MSTTVVFIFIPSYHVFLSTRWPVNGMSGGLMAPGPRPFGVGVGTVVMALNVFLLSCYTFGCHSLRHLIGGGVDCYSCARAREGPLPLWPRLTLLNQHPKPWGPWSPLSVGLTAAFILPFAL